MKRFRPDVSAPYGMPRKILIPVFEMPRTRPLAVSTSKNSGPLDRAGVCASAIRRPVAPAATNPANPLLITLRRDRSIRCFALMVMPFVRTIPPGLRWSGCRHLTTVWTPCQSPHHHAAGAIPCRSLIREIGCNHVLHRDAHRLVDRDLGVADAAGRSPEHHRAQRRPGRGIEARELATADGRRLEGIEGLHEQAMRPRQCRGQLAVRWMVAH